ncbi:MAG TPA: hypothetical protein VGJ84_11510 [Polyangiaceae bacterium]
MAAAVWPGVVREAEVPRVVGLPASAGQPASGQPASGRQALAAAAVVLSAASVAHLGQVVTWLRAAATRP